MAIVTPSLTYFPSKDVGRPLSEGYIYVGQPDTDPKNVPANRKQVNLRLENGTTVSVGQPLRTSAGGIVVYNNAYAVMLVDGDYSIHADNKSQAKEYYIPNNAGLFDLSQVGGSQNGNAKSNMNAWLDAQWQLSQATARVIPVEAEISEGDLIEIAGFPDPWTVTAGAAPDDHGFNLALTNYPTLHLRSNSKEARVDIFGCDITGATHSTTQYQNCLNFAAANLMPVRLVGRILTQTVGLPDYTKILGAEDATEFSPEYPQVAYDGTVAPTGSIYVSPTGNAVITGVLFSGHKLLGNTTCSVWPDGGWRGGGLADLQDFRILGVSFNQFKYISNGIRVLRIYIDDYQVNNCHATGAEIPFWWKGADSWIGKGLFGNNATISQPNTLWRLEMAHTWIGESYLSGFGCKRLLEIQSSSNLKFDGTLFDISDEAAIYIVNNSNPVQLDRCKFGYNNLAPTGFQTGIITIYDSKNVIIRDPIFDGQTINPDGSPRASILGHQYKIQNTCENIRIIDDTFVERQNGSYTNSNDINVTDPSEVLIATSFDLAPPSKVTSVTVEPVAMIYELVTRGVAKIDLNYVGTGGRQLNLDRVTTVDGSIVKISNQTGQITQVGNKGAGVFDTLNPTDIREYIKVNGDFTVY